MKSFPNQIPVFPLSGVIYFPKTNLILVPLDYKLKEIGVISEFYPSGNLKNDMKYIEQKYKSVNAKFPKLYNPIIL